MTNNSKSRFNGKTMIDKRELAKIVFWAHTGLGYAEGGSYANDMPKIITKQILNLKLKPRDFCCFENPLNSRKLSNDVLKEYKQQSGDLVE